jgi:adenosylcobinamide-GDP ribazoletransferase
MSQLTPVKPSRFSPAPALIALQFLTFIPPLIKRELDERELGWAVGWFPLAGLLIGLVLVLARWELAYVFPLPIVNILILALWLLCSGTLHFDGWLDSLDGLFGGRTPDQRLEIMKDERVGAFALVGGVMLLLLKWQALELVPALATSGFGATHLLDPFIPVFLLPLLIAPLFGRWAMVLAIVLFPYGRDQGLGRAMKDHAGWGELALATVLSLPFAVLLFSWRGLLIPAVVLIAVILAGRFILSRIPGLTGDSYGAICELSETVILLLLTLRWLPWAS